MLVNTGVALHRLGASRGRPPAARRRAQRHDAIGRQAACNPRLAATMLVSVKAWLAAHGNRVAFLETGEVRPRLIAEGDDVPPFGFRDIDPHLRGHIFRPLARRAGHGHGVKLSGNEDGDAHRGAHRKPAAAPGQRLSRISDAKASACTWGSAPDGAA